MIYIVLLSSNHMLNGLLKDLESLLHRPFLFPLYTILKISFYPYGPPLLVNCPTGSRV